jgi:thiamine-phosphate pyrophosphorylase
VSPLYLLTNEEPWPLLWPKLDCALSSGQVGLLQYRRKQTPHSQRLTELEPLQRLCEAYDVPLIINDEVDLAQVMGCGVHLGQGDGSVTAARQRLGPAALIGRTCHGSLALAQQAQAEGADYVAFGAVYPSTSKPQAQTVPLSVLQEAVTQLQVPVCAIGGITVDNAAPLLVLPVSWLAVIGGVLDGSLAQVAQRLQQWQRLLQE